MSRLGLSALSDTTPRAGLQGRCSATLLSGMETSRRVAETASKDGVACHGRRCETRARPERAGSRSPHDVVERVKRHTEGSSISSQRYRRREIDFLAARLVVGETYGHFVKHQAEIDAGVPRTVPRCSGASMSVAPVREAIRARGPAPASRPRHRPGWRYRDLVATQPRGWSRREGASDG